MPEQNFVSDRDSDTILDILEATYELLRSKGVISQTELEHIKGHLMWTCEFGTTAQAVRDVAKGLVKDWEEKRFMSG
ncbi:MAG: hypothetical protein HPY74_19650 [Firmicutes bacterium]|nr:hypothetical protein [Bacillota bacterium]